MMISLSSSTQVHVTLTTDQNKIFKALQPLEPKGNVNFVTAIRIAHVSSTFLLLVITGLYNVFFTLLD